MRDPADGASVVQQVYKREEIFHGIRTQRLPDLVLHTDRARYVSFGHADFGSNKVIEPSIGQTGHHHMVGIVGLRGPGVRPGLPLAEASILDLAPTILHYLGLPVPSYMDGRVLTEAFTADFLAENEVRTVEADPGREPDATAYDNDEEDVIMAKLRDMGYVA